MHKIFFERNSLVICIPPYCPDVSGFPTDIGGIFGNSAFTDSHLEALFGQERSATAIWNTEDEEDAYRKVCGAFREVYADGGLVRGPGGVCLLIERDGVWDLPKGHREKGETSLECALREVGEETGVTDLKAGNMICITDHCYLRGGVWYLKHTCWWNMSSEGGDTVPQAEEGITGAVWATPASLPGLLSSAYPSVREVFASAGFSEI